MFLRVFLFIILIFFLINDGEYYINGQIVYASGSQELSLLTLEPFNQFSLYPTSSNFNTCDVQLKVLLVNSKGEYTPGFLASEIFTVTNISSEVFILSTSIPFFGAILSVNATSSNGTTTFNINLLCNKIDFKQTIPQIIGEKPGYNVIDNFHSFLKIEGFVGLKPQTFLTDENVGKIEPIPNSDLYIIKWSPSYIPDHIQGEWSIEIFDSFGGGNIFKTNSYYYDVPASPNNFDNGVIFPPDSLPVLFEFGFGFGPLQYGNVRSNTNRPFLIITNGNATSYSTPISGSKGDMIFINSFIENEPFNGINITEFIIYSPVGQNTIQIKTKSLIVQKYLPTSLEGNPFVAGFGKPFLFSLIFYPKNYLLNDYEYKINENKLTKGFPFGFSNGTNSKPKIDVSIPGEENQNNLFLAQCRSVTLSDTIKYNQTLPIGKLSPPTLTNFEIVQLSQLKYLLKLHIVSINGLFQINSFPKSNSNEMVKIDLKSLIAGDLYDGDYEIILSTQSLHKIQVIDTFRNIAVYSNFDIISLNPIKQYISPFISYKFNLDDFNNTSFAINDMNLLNSTGYNIMYINSTTLQRDVPMSLMLLDPVSISINKNIRYPIVYNDDIKMFECKFIIPSNNIFGELPYVIFYSLSGKIYNSLLPKSAQLRVNQTYLDNQGPVFSSIVKNGESTSNTSSISPSIGWSFDITDNYNGFETGYIKVMGSIDNSVYHFNFTTDNLVSGDQWKGSYNISIMIDGPCVSQDFVITHVTLLDRNQIPSIYSIFSENQKPISNPFINSYSIGISITRLSTFCRSIFPVLEKPVIKELTLSKRLIDVGSTERSITLNATIDLPSGNVFYYNQAPIFYMTSSTMDLIECQSTIEESPNQIKCVCEMEVPVGFGYPGPIFISIFGFLNKNGYYFGYSTQDILSYTPGRYYINTTFSSTKPIITAHDDVYYYGGKIWLFGIGFSQTQNVYIKYLDRGLSNGFDKINSISYSTALAIIIRETNQPFFVKTVQSDGVESNEYLISPIPFISPPVKTTDPLPTNSPQACKGNPQCGGSKQGYCSSNGCLCYPPWVGATCQSKVVIVPPPKLNYNEPSTNITKPSNGSSSSENSSFTALVSIVSLRELDFNGSVIKTYKYEKWLQTKLNEYKFQYMTNLETSFNNGTKLNCTTIVITEWFNSTTNITFASQQLIMNPSTLKYNINITSYPFENQLNSLELIIQAKAFSKQTDSSCSSQDFGDTVLDNSNYIQLTVNDHSLYGRFIKRAIVDGKLNSINNKIVNDLNDDTTYYSSESHVAISIPNYKELIQLDPDFGILLDTQSIKSICKENNDKKLSIGAIVGIVVGCVGGAILITIAIVLAKKYKYHLRNIKPLKLKKMNN
ncbi:hypothetical protein RB653_004530 [Dictyostelium firmibasis]|uniref:EGF-like domain-containing protein n=1 Tax=Dictyostelium firmibasis TaxID=79012 RepID=A0AAN7U7N3_9MYCE